MVFGALVFPTRLLSIGKMTGGPSLSKAIAPFRSVITCEIGNHTWGVTLVAGRPGPLHNAMFTSKILRELVGDSSFLTILLCPFLSVEGEFGTWYVPSTRKCRVNWTTPTRAVLTIGDERAL